MDFFFYQSDLNAACGKSKLDKNQANCQSIILDTANDIRHARLALIKLILKLLQTMRYKSTNRAQTESFTTVPLMESFNDMGDAPKWLCFYPQGFSLTILSDSITLSLYNSDDRHTSCIPGSKASV